MRDKEEGGEAYTVNPSRGIPLSNQVNSSKTIRHKAYPMEEKMRKKKIIFPVVLVTLLALLIAPLALAGGGFGNGPENPGPIVFRFDDTAGFFLSDFKSGLGVAHGGDVVEFCQTGSTEFDPVLVQLVDVPDDFDRAIVHLVGDDMPTTVWPFPDFDCELFTTVDPIATGTADLIYTDNDVDVSNNPNANSFGLSAHGKVTTDGGEELNLSTHSRAIIKDGDFTLLTEKVNLK